MLIFLLKLSELFRSKEHFYILYFQQSDLGFESRKFFNNFWLISSPLHPHILSDPDSDPGCQNIATDLDPKHCFHVSFLSFIFPSYFLPIILLFNHSLTHLLYHIFALSFDSFLFVLLHFKLFSKRYFYIIYIDFNLNFKLETYG